MIDEILGRATWPVAVILVVLTLVVGGNVWKNANDRSELKKEIVHSCAVKDDPVTCANNLIKTINAVK